MSEWALKRHSISDEDLFSELCAFLINERRAIQYTEEIIRKNTLSMKTNIHNVTIDSKPIVSDDSNCNKNKESDSESLKLFKLIQDIQASRDKQINETLSNLTLAFNNLSRTPNQSPNSNIGASSKWCFIHQTALHDFSECLKFKGMEKK